MTGSTQASFLWGCGLQTIKPFIDAGWWTVPLTGKLERLEDGTKTIPNFPTDWKDRYLGNCNTTDTKIGGVLTGSKSNIIAIDCDNDAVYNLFRGLDPDYEAVFISEGKQKDCGTIIYSYDDCLPNFGLKNNIIELDYYAQEGFVYLPTEANASKRTWNDVKTIKAMPESVKTLLSQLYALYNSKQIKPTLQMSGEASYLAPLVQQFVADKAFVAGLFKVITPKSFRGLPQYVSKGWLHPNNVPQGDGSNYLSRVSAILGADPSIDETLYVEAIYAINALWDDPIPEDRVNATITDPMLNCKVVVNGMQVWQYDSHWSENRMLIRTKREGSVELAYDDNRRAYYMINIVEEQVDLFANDAELVSHLGVTAVSPPDKKTMKTRMPLINVLSNPASDFGFQDSEDVTVRNFNSFIRTPELRILNDPETYKEQYNRPITTLKYLETLVPETEMRKYMLGFLKYKLTKFKYSPVILFFIGVHGSGKDMFVAILEQIMSKITRPSAKMFLEKNNSWLMDTYFIQLDEFGNQLSTNREKDECLGLIKAISGKPKIDIRLMRTDTYEYEHNATIIMTQNKNPLMVEEGDRRLAFLNTPNKLTNQGWVNQMGGIANAHAKIMSEVSDFCYYLATEVESLTDSAYMQPPDSKFKNVIIADSMYAAQRIAYAMKHGMQEYLVDLANDYEDNRAAKAFMSGNVTSGDLEDLYSEMTDLKGDVRTLNKTIRQSGIEVFQTTNNKYRYNLEWGEDE